MARTWTKPMKWDAEGTAPSASLSTNGFQAGYKPPASIFNYSLHTQEACTNELQDAVDDIDTALEGKANSAHTHSYAGSSSAGGSATSAEKLDSSAGSATKPVYFSNGVPVACTHTLGKSVPSNAVFTDTTYGEATSSAAGLMSAADKAKLDGMSTTSDYVLPAATSSTLGGVKVGNNITNSSGTISLTKDNVTDALGYTPPTTNTTYSVATTSSNGLMSADDKTKLDGLNSLENISDVGTSSLCQKNADVTTSATDAAAFNNGSATKQYSFAANSGTASGTNSCAVNTSTASATASFAAGLGCVASAAYAAVGGGYNNFATGVASFATGYSNGANAFQTVVGRSNKTYDGPASETDTTGSMFIVGVGTDSTGSNGFRVATDGTCYGNSYWVSSGADYAEYFEWLDQNSDNEDRRGKFVTLDGDKIRLANAEDDYILGVISAVPTIVGNAASEEWCGKYMLDVFGERKTEVEEVAETTDEEGNIIPAHTVTRFVLNPEYDAEKEYVPRERRQEWDAVGTHGQLVVCDDGTCSVNGYCKVAENGNATASEVKTDFRVIARLDETHIKIFIK